MGLQIRDERQMKALTGLPQAQFDALLPVFSDLYRATQQHTYADYKTYPTFDVLSTPFAMARSKAHENLHKLSPMLYDTLVHLELMPYRELATPEALKAAWQGVDRLLMDATERASQRSHDDAKQREHDSGKKNSLR